MRGSFIRETIRIKRLRKLRRLFKEMISACLCLSVSVSLFSLNVFACTAVYAGEETTENGSVFMGRSEDYGPDYVKQFVIVPSQDHEPGEMLEDDYGFRAPYPAHTLRYSAIMDDPSMYSGKTVIPYAQAGTNEKGVSVTATASTYYNDRVRETDPPVSGGLCEITMASYILQSAESAADGVRLLAECIDTYGHGIAPDASAANEVSTLLIADPKETWVFEIVSGHQYVATRMSGDTVFLCPNAIMTQQIDIHDENIIASSGLISTAKEAGFYCSDIEGEGLINVAKSYSEGFDAHTATRCYYGAEILNRDIAQNMDIELVKNSELKAQYPFASLEKGALGPFPFQYRPSEALMGRISLMTLRNVLSSHGEGTAYETTSRNVNAEGVSMRSIGTYRQNEEHLFEIRRNRGLSAKVCTIEWLALGPAEFSVFVPFYTAALRHTPDAYSTESTEAFDPESLYWLFNELGNAGNGAYYRKDKNGIYHDRYKTEVDAETAEAVLSYLKDIGLAGQLHAYMTEKQEEMNGKAASDDAVMIALSQSGTEEELETAAEKFAEENAAYAKRIASEKLAEIDAEVKAFLETPGRKAQKKPDVPLSLGLFLLLCGGVIGFVWRKNKNNPGIH
ncbi:MAG: C69 family dipeptidase [Solobacterium sp.]|nr:C69 family dipeptidase [Solobacterium sp.]